MLCEDFPQITLFRCRATAVSRFHQLVNTFEIGRRGRLVFELLFESHLYVAS